jgi:hypothetical protein
MNKKDSIYKSNKNYKIHRHSILKAGSTFPEINLTAHNARGEKLVKVNEEYDVHT